MNADENAFGSRSGAWWRLLIGLAAVSLSRLAVLQTRYWADVPYEPAPLGLEALAVLRGETPVLYWGQPYFGSLFLRRVSTSSRSFLSSSRSCRISSSCARGATGG